LRGAVLGAARYEFLMQARRKVVWIVLAIFVAWGLYSWSFLLFGQPTPLSLEQTVARWAIALQGFSPVAVGVLLADRLPRDRRTGTEEVLETLPAPAAGRLVGKYLGGTLAVILPLFAVYLGVICYVAVDRGAPMAVPLGVLAFAAINVPGLLFVCAFSVACPAVLWVPLYQFLFVGYWIWGNLLNPYGGIPTLSGTPLAPIGEYAANGFFSAEVLYSPDATFRGGVVSIALLLGLSALALYAAHLYLERQRSLR